MSNKTLYLSLEPEITFPEVYHKDITARVKKRNAHEAIQ